MDETSYKRAMWVVLPDKLNELPKPIQIDRNNFHGYTLKVSMFNDRPTAVLQYDKLTGTLISKGRDGQVLDIITRCMNFT